MTQVTNIDNRDMVTRKVTGNGIDRFIIDIGAGADATVDLVGDTAIVVFDDPNRDQLDLDLPNGDATAELSNGILTIEVVQ